MDDKGEAAAYRRRSTIRADEDKGSAMACSVPQPPYSTDLLADLHADNMLPEVSAQLWSAVRKDPAALRFLHSLDDVTTELRALGTGERSIHRIPADVSTRLERMLDGLADEEPAGQVATVPFAAESCRQPPSTAPMPAVDRTLTDSTDEPIRLDERRPLLLRGITAAAASVAVIAGSLIAVDAMRDRPMGHTTRPTEKRTVDLDGNLSSSAVLSAMGRHDVTGPLAGPGAVVECVRAAGLDRGILGSMNATYQGRPAALILLTGPRAPTITALIVGTGCAPGDPQVLSITDIG